MEDDIDDYDIPDFAPNPTWAKGPHQLVKSINELKDYAVPEITRDTVIGQLYLEASDRASRNQAARIRAWELIAELKGWKESTSEVIEENTDNLTVDEIKALKEEFDTSY